MRPYLKEMKPNSIDDLAALLALVRPGPLDFIDESTGLNMTDEYMLRRKGLSKSDIPELQKLLPETYGVLCYQEDLNKIAIGVAGMDAETAELLRENMAKKKIVDLMKMKPIFIAGAKKNITEEIAENIWNQMVTFGRYGFSIIHAKEYAHITYACMFLKHYYPLEFWASVATNAEEKEITGKFWTHLKPYFAAPDINISTDEMVVPIKTSKTLYLKVLLLMPLLVNSFMWAC
jgi:DNA polymerase-3 subunit alpha